MRRHSCCALLVAAGLFGSLAPAAAQSFSTIYQFAGGANGRWPLGGLAMDAAGDLYGTAYYDELCSTCGGAYKLLHPTGASTTWTYQSVYQFVLYQDGIAVSAPFTNFQNVMYVPASAGGDPNCACGTIFSVAPPGSFNTLYVFDPYDPINHVWPLGTTPIGGLLIDTDGTMYGTTSAGGLGQPGPLHTQGAGVVYKFSGGGYTKLHDFDGDQNGGPEGELIFGQDGAIYGTQFGGGDPNCHCGVIFRMNKDGSNYQVLYNFLGTVQVGNSHDGANPQGRLALGPDGTIYGTTAFGGNPSGYGTAWSIKNVNGSWVYNQLYIFGNSGTQSANLPHSGLILGRDGSLYGTGAGGGVFQNGAIYRLVPPVTAGGQWTYQTLHSFKGLDPNGDTPFGDLLYAKGRFYGGNLTGGIVPCATDPNGCGTVFQFIPPIAAHDFNGNSRSDIAWRNSNGDTAIWSMNGAQIITSGSLGNVPSSWALVGQRDFNGDGKYDWLWRDSSTGTVAMWLLNGLSVLQAGVLGNPVGWNISGTSDFNGDGNGDILWQDSAGNLAIWLMNGLSILQAGVLGNVPTNWKIAGTDGLGHILWRDSQSNTVAIWAVSGFQVIQAVNLGVVASTWQIKGIGDFNGDGIPDILWQDGSGNVAIWLLNSSLHLAQAGGIGAVASSWVIQETGDFNGDGNADILWRNTATGAASIWFMNGVQLSSGSVVASVPTSWVIQVLNAD